MCIVQVNIKYMHTHTHIYYIYNSCSVTCRVQIKYALTSLKFDCWSILFVRYKYLGLKYFASNIHHGMYNSCKLFIV